MTTLVRDIATKNHGDSITEFTGVIQKRYDRKTGTGKYGVWVCERVKMVDSTNAEIYATFWGFDPIPANATAVYLNAVPSKKNGSMIGVIVEVNDKGERSIQVKASGDVRVGIGQEWVPLQHFVAPSQPAAASVATPPLPQSPAPAMPSAPAIVPAPASSNGTPPVPADPDAGLSMNARVQKLPARDFVIMKQTGIKAAAEIMAALITAGAMAPAKDEERDAYIMRVTGTWERLAAHAHKMSQDVEEYIPF